MIKDIINSNETALPNAKQLEALKENFPACLKKDGSFDIERFKEFLSNKITINNEGYELKFLGKNYARLLASVDTTTVVVPDEEHNNKSENKNSENIYISGDNLDGLKHLLKSYAHKVKCIYIDPPYNTGSDGFVYNDSFNFTAAELSTKLSIDEEYAQRILDLTKRGSASHSAWLTFMYPRLLLARDLLTDDGVIFISIDDNEQGNLKLLCDDVFGEENFIGLFTIMSNPRGSQNSKYISSVHEYIFMYSKNETDLEIDGISKSDESLSEFKEVDENGRKYRLIGLRKRGGAWRKEDRPKMHYPIFINPLTGECSLNKDELHIVEVLPKRPTGELGRWNWGKDKFISENRLLIGKRINRSGENESWDIFKKDYIDSDDGIEKTTKVKTMWVEKEINYQNAKNEIKSLFYNSEIFDYPKPTYIIIKLARMLCNEENDIILDFFSGSATTAHAVMKLNAEDNGKRKFIMVQLPEAIKETSEAYKAGYKTIDEIGQERIRRAAQKIKEENPETTADLGFKHYILQEPNAVTLDKLEKFVPESQGMFVDNDILTDFGTPTVLTTWLVRDGYGFNAPVQTINFAGYTAYYMDKHLYLIASDISREAIAEIVEKYETDGKFNPENVVLFGYSFSWTELDELKINLAKLKDTEKNLRINFDVRY